MQRTQVVLLGTGNPNADPLRSGPALAIVVDDRPYLVDCGPGVVRRAAAARMRGVRALTMEKLQTVFITHLHSDHTVGLADVIFTPWVLGRQVPLNVYGPPGIRAMTGHLLQAYEQDIQIRLHGLEHGHPEGYKVNSHEIRSGIVYRDDLIKVRAFRVRHGSWPHAFGYRFETPDRVIVVSGDTVAQPNVTKYAQGCDVLVHEVYSAAGLNRLPKGWRAYHARFHTSTVALARIAAKAKPKLLVLTHQLLFGSTEEELVEEIRSRYAGKVVSGQDLDVL